MSRKYPLAHLGRALQVLPEPVPEGPPPAATPDRDPDQLAREAAHAFADQLARYRRTRDTEAPLDPRDRPADSEGQLVRDKAPEDVTFADIERLGRIDPALGTARWEEVKVAAARDLETGWRAGRALEPWGGSAWDRACFLAVRQRLRQTWPPRHHGEALLLDEIAQYETLRQHWVRLLAQLTHDPRLALSLNGADEQPSGRPPPGVAAGAAVAVRMIDRLHRLAQSALRTLLGLRRSPAVLAVQRTGQVNFNVGPQLHVTMPAADGPVIRADTPEAAPGPADDSRPHTPCAEVAGP